MHVWRAESVFYDKRTESVQNQWGRKFLMYRDIYGDIRNRNNGAVRLRRLQWYCTTRWARGSIQLHNNSIIRLASPCIVHSDGTFLNPVHAARFHNIKTPMVVSIMVPSTRTSASSHTTLTKTRVLLQAMMYPMMDANDSFNIRDDLSANACPDVHLHAIDVHANIYHDIRADTWNVVVDVPNDTMEVALDVHLQILPHVAWNVFSDVHVNDSDVHPNIDQDIRANNGNVVWGIRNDIQVDVSANDYWDVHVNASDVHGNINQNIRRNNGHVLSDIPNDIHADVWATVYCNVPVNATDVRANIYQNIRAYKGNGVSDVPNDIQADVSNNVRSDVHVNASDVRANILQNIRANNGPRSVRRPPWHPSRCLCRHPNGCPRERYWCPR